MWPFRRVGRGEARACICAALSVVLATPASFGAAERSSSAVASATHIPARPAEVTPEIEQSVARGLRYLAANQSSDGSWRTRGSAGGHPTAMTALAGLALLASGSTPREGPHARALSRGLTFLLSTARRDGLIAQLEEEYHCMHGHGFAMLFLAQCYGMEEDPARQAQIRDALARAVDLTARAQSPAGGWLYTPDSRGDEGSVTVTQVQGLRAARNAGIAVPKRVIDRAMDYLERSANPDGGIRYQVSDAGGGRAPITAAAVACWYNAGQYDHPLAQQALAYAEERLPPDGMNRTGHFMYAHLYLAQVLYQTGDEKWRPYFEKIAARLLQAQARDGAWPGEQVGPVYGTAVALLILQLPYKHLPIMQR